MAKKNSAKSPKLASTKASKKPRQLVASSKAPSVPSKAKSGLKPAVKTKAPGVKPLRTPVTVAPTVVAAEPLPQRPKTAREIRAETRAELRAEAINYEFSVGDNAVYPGHGVGRILAIETKEILGNKQTFYSVQIIETGMRIMIPKDNVASVGLRPIISQTEADRVVGILRDKSVAIDNQTWNRRYREYMEKIKTGSVYEIAEVLRDLFLLKVDKELSFGERKMLETARALLLKELSLAKNKEELFGEDEVRAIFGIEA